MSAVEQKIGRVARRREKNLKALISAGQAVMGEKGIDAATMHEIADMADVAAGTIYTYFKSKDELAIAVLEQLMRELALKIERVTDTFDDPAQVYAFGIRTVIETATTDLRWRQLLSRAEVIANAMFDQMGPFAIRDLENATAAGRFKVDSAPLTWKMATFAIVGVALSVVNNECPEFTIDETVVRLLCMTGIGREEAIEIAGRPRPALPTV